MRQSLGLVLAPSLSLYNIMTDTICAEEQTIMSRKSIGHCAAFIVLYIKDEDSLVSPPVCRSPSYFYVNME